MAVETVAPRSTGAPAKPRWRGHIHEAAFFVTVGLAPGLVAAAGSPGARLAVAVYALCLLGLFGVSALFHRVPWGPVGNRRMQRLDHSMIFVFIAGSYTPITALVVESPQREFVLAGVWVAALTGVAVKLLWADAPRAVSAGLYVAVGWVALAVAPALWRGLGPGGFGLLLAGGVVYTAGAMVYARRRPDPIPDVFGFHEVFHSLVVVAALCHLAVITFVVVPAG